MSRTRDLPMLASSAWMPAFLGALLCCAFLLAAPGDFRRGDANDDRKQDLSDAVAILSHLFLGAGPLSCDDAADVNDDGAVDVSDPVYLLNYLFAGGPAPPPPFPDAGQDPTRDSLDCAQCGRGLPRPAALACPGAGCAVLEDGVVEVAPHFRNDAPAITLDGDGVPRIVFSVAEGGYFGFSAGRQPDGTWAVEAMRDVQTLEPVALAAADMVTDDAGKPLVLVNDGALHTALWTPEGAGWRRMDEAARLDGGYNHGLARAEGGCLHAAMVAIGQGPTQPGLARHTGGAWTFSPAGEVEGGLGPVVALSPHGEPGLVYWSSMGSKGWFLRWKDGALDPETVVELGSNGLERTRVGFELTQGASAPEPHVLVSRISQAQGQPAVFVLDYRFKSAVDGWHALEVAREDPIPDCGQPNSPGETCEIEHTSFLPHRILADATGRVLMIFSRLRVKATYTARCVGGDPGDPAAGPPPPLCEWDVSQKLAGDLMAGWIDAGAVRTDVLAPNVTVAGLDVVAGPSGELHLAVYENQGDFGNTSVRYLRIGAR